jgi:hypothetical protein
MDFDGDFLEKEIAPVNFFYRMYDMDALFE